MLCGSTFELCLNLLYLGENFIHFVAFSLSFGKGGKIPALNKGSKPKPNPTQGLQARVKAQ